jgi:FSR family fosmidomycin resistance protein-like MFS transporter
MDSPAQALPLAPAPPRLAPAIWTVLLFSLGHFFVDLYGGSLGVLQPFLVDRFRLSLTQAGVIGGLLVFSSSVTQPLYGYLSDRFPSRLFSALGPAIAGLMILGATAAPNYAFTLVMMMLGGSAISAFHPQASSWATAGMGREKATWMAVFISAGTLGVALAPAFFKEVIDRIGLPHILWAAVPGVVVSILLLLRVSQPGNTRRRSTGFDWAALRAVRRPMAILYAGVFFRSVVQVSFAQFLVLYLSRERHYSISRAAYVATAYLTAGALGGFVGGNLADRFGSKRIILHSFAWSVPLMLVFFLTDAAWGIVSLIIGGFILLFTIPVNVVVAQRLVPSQAGTVSALLMGFAWGMAGVLFIPLTGWIADHSSLHAALSSLLIFPVLGFFCTRMLPENLG